MHVGCQATYDLQCPCYRHLRVQTLVHQRFTLIPAWSYSWSGSVGRAQRVPSRARAGCSIAHKSPTGSGSTVDSRNGPRWLCLFSICGMLGDPKTLLHCVSKKVSTFTLSVTLSNVERFSKILHCWKAYEICYKTYMALPTSP